MAFSPCFLNIWHLAPEIMSPALMGSHFKKLSREETQQVSLYHMYHFGKITVTRVWKLEQREIQQGERRPIINAAQTKVMDSMREQGQGVERKG